MRLNAQRAKMRDFLGENDWLKRNRDRGASLYTIRRNMLKIEFKNTLV